MERTDVRCYEVQGRGAVSFATVLYRVRRPLNGSKDPLVGPATADVPLHAADNFRLRWIGIPGQQRHPGHNHARGAVGALEGARIQECLLQRMQSSPLLE